MSIIHNNGGKKFQVKVRLSKTSDKDIQRLNLPTLYPNQAVTRIFAVNVARWDSVSPETIINAMKNIRPDILLLNEYTPYPESGIINSSNGRTLVSSNFNYVDDNLKRVADLNHSAKVRDSSTDAKWDGKATYVHERLDLKNISSVTLKQGSHTIKTIIRIDKNTKVVIYNAGTLSVKSVLKRLEEDINDERKNGNDNIIVTGLCSSNIDKDDAYAFLMCTSGMIMINDQEEGSLYKCWASLELFRTTYIKIHHHVGTPLPPHMMCIDITPRILKRTEHITELHLLAPTLENLLSYQADILQLGGPHVMHMLNAGHVPAHMKHIMYTNYVTNRRIVNPLSNIMHKDFSIFEYILGTYAKIDHIKNDVVVCAHNGWWFIEIDDHIYFWGYMVNGDSSNNKHSLYLHYNMKYEPNYHPELGKWLLLSTTPQKVKVEVATNFYHKIKTLKLLRHFNRNTDLDLCSLLTCVPRNIYEDNKTIIKYYEDLFTRTKRKDGVTLDCIKKKHDIWNKFRPLQLSIGHVPINKRISSHTDYLELWKPLFSYFNQIMKMGDILPPNDLVLFRSQGPYPGFISSHPLNQLKEGDTVQTISFAYTTFRPNIQTIVLSKSFESELIINIPADMVKEMFILSTTSHNILKPRNMPCIFLRDEVVIPPFAVFKIRKITTGLVEIPVRSSSKKHLVHSGTAGTNISKVKMLLKDTFYKDGLQLARHFYVLDFKGFSKKAIKTFDTSFGTSFEEDYKDRTLVP